MKDALGRESFPQTGNDAADAWVRDARGYIGVIANRCKTCLHRSRCRECLSLEARLLVERHDAIRFGGSIEAEVSNLERSVMEQIRSAGSAVRGDVLKAGGLKGARKTKFLMAMCAKGLIVKELRITGASGHHSLYYSLPQSNTQIKTQNDQETGQDRMA